MGRRWTGIWLCALILLTGMLDGCGASENGAQTEEAADAFTDGGEENGNPTEAPEVEELMEEILTDEDLTDEEEATEPDFTDTEENTGSGDTDDSLASSQTAALATSVQLPGLHHAQIVVEEYGTIEVELYADIAPVTVTNFVKLAQEGFYDGLTFHRIVEGFVIQGGDPNGDGTGGSGETIAGEFSNNGVENNLSHVRGTVSMARSADADSASSQFFICQADALSLDGDYAAFGTVTVGMEIVDQICADANPTDSSGTIPADQQPVIETITVLD
ncbi:MAG: peptidylprolyl isomerase [Clostridiales bacterium]|nr:peptidylprolyl isomerase [Clostridiales bacterium]